jgi:uncharacterized membrane protein
MSTKHLVAWAVTFVVLLVIDMIWLGVVAKGMYQEAMGDLMSPNPRLAFAAVFYLAYPIGLLVFAIVPGLGSRACCGPRCWAGCSACSATPPTT